jgi:flagellar hook-associated protein 3
MPGWGAIRHNTFFALGNQMSRIARLHEQVSSGMRVIRSSDAPGDAYRIMNLQTEDTALQTYIGNLDTVSFNMGHIAETMQRITDDISRTRELLTQAASGTYRDSSRKSAGNELDLILENILSLINSKSMGSYLFGGAQLTEAPYVATRSDGRITDVIYQGSHARVPVPVAPGVNFPGTVVGDDVFRSDQVGQATVPGGLTGAAPGQGTPSVRGDVWLTIAHTATNYTDPGGTGIVASPQSPLGDTIIGTHTLTVETGAVNTIRLDNGEKIAFNAETNLMVTNEFGDVAFVDVSGWSGAAGTLTLDSDGTMSIDGGATATAIDFTGNQAVSDAEGHVVYIDSGSILRTGVEPIRVSGSYDLFGTLIATRDLLLNEGGLFSEQKQVELLGKALDSVQEVLEGITQEMTSIGARIQAMDSLGASLDDLKYSAETGKALLQDADIVQVATDLANQQTYYQMTLQSSARLLSLSLLDFI